MIKVVFMPHPPAALPELRRGQGFKMKDTIQGYELMAQKIGEYKPSTIVFITPHGNSFANGISLLDGETVGGNLASFGYEDISVVKTIDRQLNTRIYDRLDHHGILSIIMDELTAKSYNAKCEIDHGTIVPMHFIDQCYSDYKSVIITPSGQSLFLHYKMGTVLREELLGKDDRVLILCSGDLSHALKEDGPYVYNPFGKTFDQMVVEAILKGNPKALIHLTEEDEKAAAQCGLRSFLMGFGMVDGYDCVSEVVSYEGPFGVGYLTGYMESDLTTKKVSILKEIEDIQFRQRQEHLNNQDGYVKLARSAVDYYVHRAMKLPVREKPDYMSEEVYDELINTKAGAFVSIYKEGRLRGCIGTTEPTADNLMDEIIYCAISACASDPRFNPVEISELELLDVKVDRLYQPEPIYDLDEMDPSRYGIIVMQGRRRGLLLPNIEGIDSVKQQVHIAKQKAGIHNDDDLVYYRFEVERHE